MKLNIKISLLLVFVTALSFCQNKSAGSYPFNQSSKIQLFIFENLEVADKEWSKITCVELPKINGTIDISKLLKSTTLNSEQVENLFEVVNFQKNDCSENVYEKKKCNEAGYGVLFFDNSGKVFEFIEICFNCLQFETSSSKMNLGLMCYDKYQKFEQLFNDIGLKVVKYRNE